jgi:hypothetical protein
MPRGTRLDVAGALHYVMQRGMERGTIFRDPDDYKRFLIKEIRDSHHFHK